MSDYSSIRLRVKSLTVDCPNQNALPDCPLNDLRSLPLAERLETVDKMPAEQLEEIIRYHLKCLKMREN